VNLDTSILPWFQALQGIPFDGMAAVASKADISAFIDEMR
jgi:hypothetical protein